MYACGMLSSMKGSAKVSETRELRKSVSANGREVTEKGNRAHGMVALAIQHSDEFALHEAGTRIILKIENLSHNFVFL